MRWPPYASCSRACPSSPCPEHAVPLRTDPDWWPIGLAAGVAAAAVVAVERARPVVRADRSRPAILREEGRHDRGTTLVGTVLRGLRARALLSAGSVLLTALAIGSAVLGPIFQRR